MRADAEMEEGLEVMRREKHTKVQDTRARKAPYSARHCDTEGGCWWRMTGEERLERWEEMKRMQTTVSCRLEMVGEPRKVYLLVGRHGLRSRRRTGERRNVRRGRK